MKNIILTPQKKAVLFSLFTVLIFFYLFTRLYHMTILPIFFDESLYIFYAKLIATSGKQWFIALTDGKMPYLTWMMAFFLKLLPSEDFLVAGRLPSVAGGFVSLIGIHKLGSVAFSRKTGLVAGFLYVLSPFALLYDRMALFDSWLCAMVTWTSYFLIKTYKSPSSRNAIFWGIFAGLGFFFKATAVYHLFSSLLIYSAVSFFKGVSVKRIAGIAFVVLLISQILDNLIIVSTGYREYWHYVLSFISKKNNSPLPIQELFVTNLSSSIEWLVGYLTPGFSLAAVLGLGLMFLKKRAIGAIFLTLTIGPIVLFCLSARIYFPRYILFVLPFLLISAAYLIVRVSKVSRHIGVVTVGLAVLLLAPLLKFDQALLWNPEQAPLPALEREQYVSGFPSGYGIEETYKFLDSELQTQDITVVIQGSYTHYPNAFLLRYSGEPRINILERWPLRSLDKGIMNEIQKRPVYFVIAQRYNKESGMEDVISGLGMEIVKKFDKPGDLSGKNSVYVTKVKSYE